MNNAGFGLWNPLHETEHEQLDALIALNVAAVTDISRAFIPLMRANRHGYLVNITSLAAYSSIPMQGAYSATKAYVLSLTEALWAESQDTGVRVLAYAPGVTRTEFFDVLAENRGAAPLEPTPGPCRLPPRSWRG